MNFPKKRIFSGNPRIDNKIKVVVAFIIDFYYREPFISQFKPLIKEICTLMSHFLEHNAPLSTTRM
jgi:hypothetical protein